LLVFVVSEVAGQKHVHIVEPSDPRFNVTDFDFDKDTSRNTISRFAEEGHHTAFATVRLRRKAVPCEKWQATCSPQ
jgi:hypothetical protein